MLMISRLLFDIILSEVEYQDNRYFGRYKHNEQDGALSPSQSVVQGGMNERDFIWGVGPSTLIPQDCC